MFRIAKILLSIAAIQYGVIPPIIDLTESHVFHPDWRPHARFHMVWLLVLGSSLALYVLISIWRPSGEQLNSIRYASIIGYLVLAGFFVAMFTRSSYGGSLSDLQDPVQVLGIDGNVFSFSIAAILQLTGTAIVWSISEDAV